MLVQKIDEMLAVLTEARTEAAKFEEKNNKAAGTRVRKAMQDIKVKAQDIRTCVSNAKNGVDGLAEPKAEAKPKTK